MNGGYQLRFVGYRLASRWLLSIGNCSHVLANRCYQFEVYPLPGITNCHQVTILCNNVLGNHCYQLAAFVFTVQTFTEHDLLTVLLFTVRAFTEHDLFTVLSFTVQAFTKHDASLHRARFVDRAFVHRASLHRAIWGI